MTYVIGSACVDVMDKSCMQDCPVDCIYEGARSLYINPDECVDCGACKFICRMDAIYYETDLPEDQQQHLGDNAAFFLRPCRSATIRWDRLEAPPHSGGSVWIHRWSLRLPRKRCD